MQNNNFSAKHLSTDSISELADLKNQFGLPHLDTETHVKSEGDCNYYELVRKDKLFYTYKLNNVNFRGNNWDTTSTRSKIGFFGCSFTFGEFVDQYKIFPTIVANKLNFNGFNFGVPGSSIQRVCRSFSAASRCFDFEYAVVVLPDWNRIHYLNNDIHGARYLDISAHSPNFPTKVQQDFKSYIRLGNDQALKRTIDSVDWILDIARISNTKVILSSWSELTYNALSQLYPDYTIGCFPIIDTVIDNDHPDEQSHKEFARMIVNRINKLSV